MSEPTEGGGDLNVPRSGPVAPSRQVLPKCKQNQASVPLLGGSPRHLHSVACLTMKFRPLCIDYHSRAQEVVATEREIRARRMALQTLRVPPASNRQLCDDDDAGSPDRGDDDSSVCDGKENRAGGEVLNSNDGDDLENIRALPDEHGVGEPAEDGIDSVENSSRRRRIQSIIKMLGPAVHPSECAFRPIEPVTEGPVMGRRLPVPATQPLERLLKFHSDFVEKKRNDVIGSLESGRSRFHSSGNDVLSCLSGGSASIDNDCMDSTFIDTMTIVYARGGQNGEDSFLDRDDPDKENALQSLIWSQHVANLPVSESLYLRHEPEDLSKIYRLKSQRSNAPTTTFANDISNLFTPKLDALESQKHCQGTKTRNGFALLGPTNDSGGRISTAPKIDLISSFISKPSKKKEDYSMRLNSVLFTQFLDDDVDMNGDDAVQLSNSLVDDTRFIRVDPDFDPLCQMVPKKKRKPTHELLRPFNEMCSASTISARLQFPARFEKSHELTGGLSRYLLPQKKLQLELIGEALLKSFKESVALDQSSDLLLTVLASRIEVKEMQLVPPRKIDTDLETPSLLPEDEDDTTRSKPDTSKILGSSILKLPSFSGMVPPYSGTKKMMTGATGHTQLAVKSSSRVCRVDSLKNVVRSSKATCLFLPQSTVQRKSDDTALAENKLRQSMQKETEARALMSAIRSCVPSRDNIPDSLPLLQEQCSTYPVAPWFECENGDDKSSSLPSEIDETALNMKRRSFCGAAKARSSGEGSRCLLLTGCSSRRNADSKYSYRGFLTNQVVDPTIFEHRYNAMVEMNKRTSNRKASSEVSNVALAPSQLCSHESFFARMALGVFAEAFTRHKAMETQNSQRLRTKRSAPYAPRLKTKMHGESKIAARKAAAITKALPIQSGILLGSKIDELARSFNHKQMLDRLAESSSGTHCGADARRVVEELGKSSLKVRGELLHLVTKARELEDEKQSYLAELAVVNRAGRVKTPTNIDLSVPDDNRKRKAASIESVELTASASEFTEQDKKRMRKEKKRRKKEKKKRKKHKRKHRDVGAQEEDDQHEDNEDLFSKKRRVAVEAMFKSQEKQHSSENVQPKRVAIPSIPLGMTPVNPPKKPEVGRKMGPVQSANLQHERLPDSSEGDNFEASPQEETEFEDDVVKSAIAAKEKSPESVADLDLGTKHEGQPHHQAPRETTDDFLRQREDNYSADSYQKLNTANTRRNDDDVDRSHDDRPSNEYSPSSQVKENAWQEASSLGGEEEQPGDYEKESSFLSSNLDGRARENERAPPPPPPLTLLTSERFLETFGETVQLLASGRWQKTLSESDKASKNIPTGIVVCDCPLVDIAGVDVELLDDSAIVVQRLSSWSDCNQTNGNNGGNPAGSVQQGGSRAFIRRLVLLAASGRYNAIHVILCLDVEISSALPREIATLQNAVMQQSGCPCEHVTFEYATPRSLAASIALRSASASTLSRKVAEFVSDENVQERARFLVMLCSGISVHMALRCLGFSPESNNSTESGVALQNLFSMAKNTSRDLFPYKTEGVLSVRAAEQLWMALNTDISHAY